MGRKRGVALFIVLIVTTLVVVLTGAFMGINSSALSLLGAAGRHKEAQLAAQSGLNYALFRMERDQTWGSAPGAPSATPPSGTCSWPPSGVPVTAGFTSNDTLAGGVGHSSGKIATSGELTMDQQFSLTVYNNLASLSAAPIGGTTIPANTCVINAVGTSGGFDFVVQGWYQGQPVYDSSCVSNGLIDLSGAKAWNVTSLDPNRNWVRSNTDIYCPDVLSGTAHMLLASSASNSIPGILWAKGDIYNGPAHSTMNTTQQQSFEALADPVGIPGLLSPFARLSNSVYKMSFNDIKSPNSAGNFSLPSGNYQIISATVPASNYYDTYDALGFATPHGATGNGTVKILVTPTASFFVPGSEVGGTVGPSPYDVTYYPAGNWTNSASVLNLPGSGTPGTVTFDFGSNNFTITNKQAVSVNGDLSIQSTAGSNISNVRFQTTIAGQPPPLIHTVNGSVTFAGTFTGQGSVAADNDITLATQTNITEAISNPAVLWAGHDVNLFALTTTGAAFCGLIYSQNNFNLYSPNPVTPVTNISIQGALVSQAGGINLTTADYVSMCYDPSYLTNLTTAGFTMNIMGYTATRKIQLTSWRPLN